VSEEVSEALILKKARWIIDKLALVKAIEEDDIVTGARLQYLGRKYYVQIYINDDLDDVQIDFTHSKFNIHLPRHLNHKESLQKAYDEFLRVKARQRITPRVMRWSRETGLRFNELKFIKLEKRWGSCTSTNNIILNVDAIKLSYSMIDYLIVHELVHTKIKNHSKEFWAELSKWLPNWKELDEQMYEMKLYEDHK